MKNFSILLYKYWPFFLGLFLGLYYFTLTVTGTDFSFYPGDLGDSRFNIYILEHAYRFFFVGDVPTSSYWNAPFIYPQESIITFSDNLLGATPFYIVFRIMGYSPISSFQLWFVVMTILNFTTAFIFFQWLLKDKYAATIGAMVFAFSIALFSQMAHPQTFPRFCIPLAFLFACKFHRDFKVKHFFLTIFFVVYQFYCALYLGFMLMVPIAILLISTALIRIKEVTKVISLKWFGSMLGALTINVFIILPLMLPYLNSPVLTSDADNLGYTDYEIVLSSIPPFKAFFFIGTYTYWWGFLNQVANDLPAWWDHQLFPSATVIASSCFVFLYAIKKLLSPTKKQNSLFICLMIVVVLTFALFIRTGDFSLYQYLYDLPGFGSMRSLARIINVELLFFGLITALAFFVISKETKYKGILFLASLAVFIPDNYIYPEGYVRASKSESKTRLAYLEEEMSKVEKDKIVCLEIYLNKEKPIFYQIDAMLVAQKLGLKTINGYTSDCPQGYSFCGHLNADNRKAWMKLKNIPEEDVEVFYQNFDFELSQMIKKIKKDEPWLKEIRAQSEREGIPLEENIRNNAIWMLNEESRLQEEMPAK